jgi:FHA domain
MSFTCRSGHHSRTDDYCEVCGAWNRDIVGVVAATATRASSAERCPNCATLREDEDRYCPSCGYDFETGEALEPAHAAHMGQEPPPAAEAELVVVLSVDGQRPNEAGCPEPPEDRREHIFALDRRSLAIGRVDAGDLQIPIHGDPYVSRRHAEIIQLGAGWGLRDLGSTNGTKLNGTQLEGSEIRVLGADDVIELGCFSRLTVRSRARLEPGLPPVPPQPGRDQGGGEERR